MVIVDEASMLDLLLTNHLLKAVHPESHLLLVGDVDQLPSVGAGNVLNDVIESGVAAVVRLTEIFRQAEGSLIVVNAHRINQGQMPLFRQGGRPTFFSFPPRTPSRPPTWWWTWCRTASRASSAWTRWPTSRCSRPCTGARRAWAS